jgi:transcription initiation factor IIF auxiliary subunit
MTTEQQAVTKSESELLPVSPTTTDELSQVHRATQALVDALKGLAQAKIQSATDLTQEAHQGIEKSVQVLRDEADQSWHHALDRVEDIDERVTKAAKVAWEALTAPSSKS